MTHPGWQSKAQKRIALAMIVIAAPVLYLWAQAELSAPPAKATIPPAVARAIGDYETAKAINDKSRGCFYAGVVVATMISARDTAGAQEWRKTERYTCEYGF
ncbi:hypothetical protein [Gemmatimonas sp.]|uniref:hypothetical protein n=1 Tax=Gemmatimonas sp. TaxID=1962908 RepID=UPI00333FAB1A